MSEINEVGHATESFPSATTVPATEPTLGDGQAKLAMVNGLLAAFKSYERASSAAEKASSQLWQRMAAVGRMTKTEGEPILKEFLRLAREDKERYPQAVSTVEQYASRVRAGWREGVAANDGEGANAFYARIKRVRDGLEKPDGTPTEKANAEASAKPNVQVQDKPDGDRAKLMANIRTLMSGMTNAELAELAKWLDHKYGSRSQPEKKAA